MLTVTTPDWLARHDCTLARATQADSWLVLLRGEPHYRLTVVPASGKYTCQVMQTINGRRLDGGTAFPSVEEALQGGLEDLRKALGW